MDLEQLLHKELDAARNAQTVAQMKAARPLLRPSQRISTAKISNSRIPPMPIHTLPPPARDDEHDDDDDDATCIYDRASNPKVSLSSHARVAFPAPNFSAPRKPQPFATIPSMPAAKRKTADTSQGITPIQPVLPPTSRRELVMPKPNESVPPMSFPVPSAFPSYPPPPQASPASTFAAILTMTFALASMIVIGVAVFKPTMLERGKVAVVSAMKPKHAATAQAPKAAAAAPPVATIAVPPILIDDEPDVTIGDQQTYAIFPASAKGHRVFMDGRAIGDGDVPALVDCGRHKLQLGSSGKERAVDLPCGGGLRLSE